MPPGWWWRAAWSNGTVAAAETCRGSTPGGRATARRHPAAVLVAGRRGPAPRAKAAPKPPELFLGEYHPYVALDTAKAEAHAAHYAYLRVNGAHQKCTFCTIPRSGPHGTPSRRNVLAEAPASDLGWAVELNLIGQDTYQLREDLGGGTMAGLLRQLNQLDARVDPPAGTCSQRVQRRD